MAYSHRPGAFKSHLTGKTYSYQTTGKRQLESKAAAKAQMDSEERAITLAAEQRAGRPVSLREMREGVKEPDMRSIRERVEEEVQHAKRPDGDTTASAFTTRIADLENKLAYTTRKQDRASIERTLVALRDRQAKHTEQVIQQEAMEEMYASVEYKKHLRHAEDVLSRTLQNPTASDSEIVAARQRLKLLRENPGGIEEYRESYERYEAQTKDTLLARQGELERRLADVKAEYPELGIGEGTNGLLEPSTLHPSGEVPADE